MEKKEGIHLISDEGYLESVRFLGLTTVDAINELIDNSFDADADNVSIKIVDKDKKISISVEDDGRGIEPESINKALSFGGRVPNNNSKNKVPTGRFGWGLSSSACCQTKRTEVYSKVKGKQFHMAYIDLDELRKLEKPLIYAAVPCEPPLREIKDADSGTIILLKDCDNLERNSVNGLITHLMRNIGEVHRKYLAGGKKISINGKEIKISDPLMLIPGCMYSDEIGMGKEYARIEPVVFSEIIDPITKKPAEVTLKIVLLDIAKIRKQDNWKSIVEKVGINQFNQGFYLMRHNRQIARALTFDLYARHNSLNYFRAEISFSPCLDSLFGVQTNKSRFSLSDALKDKIRARLAGVLEQMKNDIEKIKTQYEQSDREGEVKPAEKIAAKVDKLLKSSKYKPSIDEVKKTEEELKVKLAEEVEKIKKDKSISEDVREKRIKTIENNFQFRRPFRLVLDHIESGHFYLVRPKGLDTEVVINTAHPFFTKIYERAVVNGMDTYLDLLIFALAKAEMEYYDKEDVNRFYNTQRGEWSAILAAFLDECFENDQVE
jgi:hypothetical protein